MLEPTKLAATTSRPAPGETSGTREVRHQLPIPLGISTACRSRIPEWLLRGAPQSAALLPARPTGRSSAAPTAGAGRPLRSVEKKGTGAFVMEWGKLDRKQFTRLGYTRLDN